ncbi:hypothetical protein Tco_1116686 [Tanacetum coccineum]
MPFILANTPATFQCCMTAIFHKLIEDSMEVFMGNFSIFDSSFDHCLKNLEKILERYEETNLVLNWEKCHLMVKEGIAIGHKVSGSGIKVDKAKIKAISKLLYPHERESHPKLSRTCWFLQKIHKRFLTSRSPYDPAPDYANYLASQVLHIRSTRQEEQKFFNGLRHYFLDEPFLFKQCTDRIIRRCIAGDEEAQILRQCNSGLSGGHHGIATTARKIFKVGFYWPHIFRDTCRLVKFVMHVNKPATSARGMKHLKSTSKSVKYSMFRE